MTGGRLWFYRIVRNFLLNENLVADIPEGFATIVKAVELGRALYDNLLRYIRYQMGQLFGFILTFLPQFLLGNAGMPRRYPNGGAPLTARAIGILRRMGTAFHP